jgi:hypothetical protein
MSQSSNSFDLLSYSSSSRIRQLHKTLTKCLNDSLPRENDDTSKLLSQQLYKELSAIPNSSAIIKELIASLLSALRNHIETEFATLLNDYNFINKLTQLDQLLLSQPITNSNNNKSNNEDFDMSDITDKPSDVVNNELFQIKQDEAERLRMLAQHIEKENESLKHTVEKQREAVERAKQSISQQVKFSQQINQTVKQWNNL